MSKADAIGVVEAAYEMQGDATAWCRGVAAAMDGMLDAGLGAQTWIYTVDDAGVALEVAESAGADPGVLDLGRSMVSRLSAHPMGELLAAPRHPVTSLSEALAASPSERFGHAWGPLGGAGLSDVLAVFAVNCGGRPVNGAAPLPHASPANALLTVGAGQVTDVGADMVRRLSMLAVHVAAGLRLRRTLASQGLDVLHWDENDPDQDGVVFAAASAQPVHAVGRGRSAEVRDLLRHAVVRIDRARRHHKTQGDEALAAWNALIDGRYSIVDHFDSDGRRFVVARVNEPGALDPRGLTRRERQVIFYAARGYANKLVGYTLGLSTSAVGTHLKAAMRKLRIVRKSDLPRSLPRDLAADQASVAPPLGAAVAGGGSDQSGRRTPFEHSCGVEAPRTTQPLKCPG